MNTKQARKLSVLACLAAGAAFAGDLKQTEPMAIAVHGGTASFVANTNVPGISVKGKSSALEARGTLRKAGDSIAVEHIEATLPVKALGTGMALRDEHMRKLIFTTQDGQVPDVRFEGGNSTCSTQGRNGTCQIAGTLSIRGVARPFTLPLKVREDGNGFKASGDGTVKLSAYGIEQPSQLGVKTTDDVQVHFEFTAQTTPNTSASLGGAR